MNLSSNCRGEKIPTISLEELKEKCKEFKSKEGRASFYDIAVAIADKHPVQASVIILATWNVGRFRFMLSDSSNLDELEEALKECKPFFKRLENKKFSEVNFDEMKDIVKQIYKRLSTVKGIEYTGASKIMHLFCRDLFVMWDNTIRKKYSFPQKAKAKDYLEFQECMQEKFRNIGWDDLEKPLTKAIDEYNYITFTLPELEKRRRKEKKNRKKKKQEAKRLREENQKLRQENQRLRENQ